MNTIRHNDCTFTEIRCNAVNIIIHILGYCTDEYITVKLSMYEGLKTYIEDNY
jgi:hypothetical protein